ncbi:PEP-CTERM sorting domain-containing protein [Aeoliella mucimassa]|uniref:PEP-CTERM protein-sorting domain-containing protein n=1 Tax=Aeoliella mucimassa TaxID=2527972 RepID=A0A518AWJ1_9BACT|nr:PEP-CTERM sorting domain-containing protein [Aeoliella mucimassa]QDU59109.1 hypothetical protein Pan181_53500 [Aeoliella mucimassa]
MIRIRICASLLALAGLSVGAIAPATAELLHLWDFNAGNEMADSVGTLDLNPAPGEGSVTIDDNGTPGDTSDDVVVTGTAGDIIFEPGYMGVGQAFRPYYVDSSQSSTAGAGLTGKITIDDNGTPDDTGDDIITDGFASPNQFTIETIVRVDAKTTGSAVNYIFQTRPGSDRGYYLIQDEDNVGAGSTGGVGSIIGNNFGDVGIGAEYDTEGTWLYYAAVIDLTSTPGQAVADVYAADLSAGETIPTLILNDRTWNSADPSALAGVPGIFGIGGFAIDRDGDGIAEASQEWFQGAIDYIAIYDGLLTADDLAVNLEGRRVPEPTSLVLLALGATLWAGARRFKVR